MNFLTLLSPLIDPVAKYFGERQVIKAEKTKRKDELSKLSLETKLEGIRNASEADMQMDVKARGVAGWMDDFSFFVFMLPALLAFVPSMVPTVTAGFIALEAMPEYYQLALGMMLVAVWGYRRLVTPIVEILIKNSVMGKKK